MSVRVATTAAAFFLLLLGGCSSETSELSRVAAELDCEREGYPCTLGELPEAVWDEMNRLGMASAHLLNSGSRSLRELADELEAVPGVVEVQTGERAIRFRVEGGRPVDCQEGERGRRRLAWALMDGGRVALVGVVGTMWTLRAELVRGGALEAAYLDGGGAAEFTAPGGPAWRHEARERPASWVLLGA